MSAVSMVRAGAAVVLVLALLAPPLLEAQEETAGLSTLQVGQVTVELGADVRVEIDREGEAGALIQTNRPADHLHVHASPGRTVRVVSRERSFVVESPLPASLGLNEGAVQRVVLPLDTPADVHVYLNVGAKAGEWTADVRVGKTRVVARGSVGLVVTQQGTIVANDLTTGERLAEAVPDETLHLTAGGESVEMGEPEEAEEPGLAPIDLPPDHLGPIDRIFEVPPG